MRALFLLFGSISFLFASTPSDFPSTPSLRAKFSRLQPSSLMQNLAFYELYPETKEGYLALLRASSLLDYEGKIHLGLVPLSSKLLSGVVYSFSSRPASLTEEEITSISSISSRLTNRPLLGKNVWSEEEVLALPSEEIDLARALLLLTHKEDKKLIQTYEAYLDFMALQIMASLPKNPKEEELVTAMNDFIFFDMRFKFPPHSLWEKDIDDYTFLSSVIDKRKGVCLGVSILYLSLAQRLNLPLEIVTPPGHIFIRLRKEDSVRNIETTARGIHIPSERYLSIDTFKLPQRTMKEVIGLALMNEASVLWGKEEYEKVASLYEKALLYLPEDPLLLHFLAYNYLFLEKKEKALPILESLQGKNLPFSLYTDHIVEDYLEGKVNIEGIKILFSPTKDSKISIETKQQKLQAILEKYPLFHAGLYQLAGTYLQLGNEKEALRWLEKLSSIDPHNPSVNYYLSALYLQRSNYPKAWKHLQLLEKFLQVKNHFPKPFKELKQALCQVSFSYL